MKIPKNVFPYIYLSLFILIVSICIYVVIRKVYPPIHLRPHVKSIHVINLDKDTERWASIEKGIAITPERWSATYGKDYTQEELVAQGIGYAITRSGSGPYSEQGGKNMRNLGVAGCYLSHKKLLKYLSELDVPDYYGHLILEDDVNIPRNFLEPGDEWHKYYWRVPVDWDMVYFDMTKPEGVMIDDGIMKLRYKRGDDGGNWGTHAYMVKHSSIKSKILPWLAHMNDAIDEQYKQKFDEWNVYCVVPGIIQLNPELSADSSIQNNK